MTTPDQLGRLLIVHRSQDRLESLGGLLRAEGWLIHTAHGADEASASLRVVDADVVLCDDLDVLGAVARSAPATPVLMLYEDCDATAAIDALRAGALDVLQDGSDAEAVVETVRRAARRATRVRDRRRAVEALIVTNDELRLRTRGAEATIEELERRLAVHEQTVSALAVARDHALAATRAKSAFLANMNHELRTPLTAILGYTELLQEEALDDGLEDFATDLDKVRRAGEQLLALINDVLELSRIESGRVAVALEPIDVARFSREVVDSAQPAAEASRNRLRLDIHDEPGFAMADHEKTRQCLLALVHHALRSIHREEVRLEVRRFGSGDEQWLVFDVVHPGGRLVVDEANRILEPFAQTDSTITRSSEDTGLGLALCRQLCELMGGTVSVLGNDDETRFTMQVPTKDAFVHAPAGPAPVVADERSTVLVIDEDDELGGLLGQTLEREGLSVLRAGSGADGLRLARAHRPGVICLGVAAPSLEGWSVLRALKSDLDLDGIPVVVVTMGEDRERGVALTATDFVVKPVNRGDLMRVLARLGVGAKGGPILVVDDSEAVREVVGRMLRAEGWEVVEAENGRVALERIAERRPALVLLDLIMPEVDGYRVVSEMHRHPEWSTIPVVIVTAADIPPTLRDFLERRVEAVIGKGGDDQRAVLDKVRRLVIHHLGSPPTLPEDG